MDIEKVLLEKIKRFEDIKNQLAAITKQIGGLTEQQRSLYNAGLELKGSIEALTEVKNSELAGSKTAGLTLPVGTKPVPAPVANETVAPVASNPGNETVASVIPAQGVDGSVATAVAESPVKQAVTLEVQ